MEWNVEWKLMCIHLISMNPASTKHVNIPVATVTESIALSDYEYKDSL